jgi:ribosomal protein L7Ae-like RNA K-turn-binding protein
MHQKILLKRFMINAVPDRYLLGQAIGKDARVVVALVDAGFAAKMKTLLD